LIAKQGHQSAMAIDKHLESFGHDSQTTEYVLSDLYQRGWITEIASNNHYGLTELGHIMYDEASFTADQYFYAGWMSLSEGELHDLHYLLIELNDTLQQAAA